jgi:hypothetical protein
MMAQFRLTARLAKDLGIPLKQSPGITSHPLDDWIGDTLRIGRKKVALLTHVHSLISFVFPFNEVGGARHVLDFLPVTLETFL